MEPEHEQEQEDEEAGPEPEHADVRHSQLLCFSVDDLEGYLYLSALPPELA